MATELSLKQRLVRFLLKQHGWIASGDLQRVVAEYTSYSPQNVDRRLRELENEGLLEVQYRTHHGAKHAFYRVTDKARPVDIRAVQKAAFEMWDSIPDRR